MPINNAEIADKFNRLANLLEIENANPFRVRAYRNAARLIATLTKNVADLLAKGQDLTELPGIGKDLAEKITVLVETGELPILKDVESRTPAVLNELMKIEGLGPKRVQILYKKLGIKSIADLNTAIKKGRLQKLVGFGEKTEQKILAAIPHLGEYNARVKLANAFPIVDKLLSYLKTVKDIKQIECAGSFRRRKETVGDLDIVVAAKNSDAIMQRFIQFEEVANVLSKGSTRATVRLHSGIQVDMRVVPEESYGAALLYFTGSKEHNIAIRKIAVQKKLKLNEYGVFKGKKYCAGATEESVYQQVGLPYIAPELRENRGEIEAAKQDRLPTLITLDDIRGDLHCHSNSTDGHDNLEALAKAAEARGYAYLAIADHSKRPSFIHRLTHKTLLAQIRAIDKLNQRLNKLVILKSVECDILEDGSLDLPDEILKELDLTVCALHSHFTLSAKKQTERILRAMDNPYFNIFAQPTGRLIDEREPYALDLERIMLAAKERGCILELNAQPDRLDLNDVHCKTAKEIGVKIAIASDAHKVSQLEFMQYGIYQARRGWLEKEDVVNTRSLQELRKWLARK